jgi:exopolyphosphatase/pppGpp-phosphohydrolase
LDKVIAKLHEKYRARTAHADQVARLSRELFAGLAGLHGLSEKQGALLEDAAYLHDLGHFVSRKKHHLHSYHIVLHDRLLEEWQEQRRLQVALLVLNHRKKKPYFPEIAKEKQVKLKRLAALLRIADGLDAAHDQRAVLEQVRLLDGGRVELMLSGMELTPHLSKIEGKFALALKMWPVVFELNNEKEKVILKHNCILTKT